MADVLQWIDGFDYYTVNELIRKYTSNSSSAAFVSGRFGGQACQLSTSSAFEISFPTTSQSWLIGFALNLQSQTGSSFNLLQIRDSGTGQVGLTWNATTRNFQFNRNGTTVGSAGTTNLTTSTWYWIEVYFTISDSISLGQCQLYINGTQEINLAGSIDTKNTANAFGNSVMFSGQSFWVFYIDDLFIYTKDTTTTPTFVGERRVSTLYPSGNGNYSAFLGSDGNSVNNYQLVDETTTGDSDYVQSSTVSDKDSYAMGDLPVTPSTITAVQMVSQMKKDDAGARTARLFSRISSADYESADITPSSSFKIQYNLMEKSPATSSAWTASEVNGMEAGVKVQS